MWTTRRTYLENGFLANPGKEYTMVTTDCRFVGIDFTYSKAQLLCFTAFWGSYSRAPTFTRLKLPPNTTLVVEYNMQSASTFSDGDMAAATTVELPLGDAAQGDNSKAATSAMYPYTILSWDLRFTAYINFTNANGTEQTDLVPYTVELTAQNIPMYQMYNIDCEWFVAGNALRITGKVALDETCLAMLTVMQAVMWMLAAATLIATIWWLLLPVSQGGDSGVNYDLLAFSAALLFALPAVRQLWPAAPSGGTVADVMHIYAQLLLISFAIMLQLGKFLYAESSSRPTSSTPDDSSVLPAQPAATFSQPSVSMCTAATNRGGLASCSSSSVQLAVATSSWPLAQHATVVGQQGVVRHSSWPART
jgi:hypothetical protein